MISTYPVKLITRISLLMLPLAVWPSSGAVAQTAGASAVLEEIVVTARRREESLQDVPISIIAFTAEDLEVRGIDNIERLNVLVPNVSINGGAIFGVTGSEILIRGIPGVAIYQDGLLQDGAPGILRNVVELERVEIMRGPQGTLFGKNSSGGAIQYITTRPAEEFGARFKATVGDFSRADIIANVDMPIGETLLTKVTGAILTRDGYIESQTIDRAYGDVDNRILRLDALWQPNDSVRARFIADYSEIDTNGQARVVDSIQPVACPPGPPPFPPGTNPRCFTPPPGYNQEAQAFPGEYKTNSDFAGKGWVQETASFTADIEWDLSDSLTLKSITGWREYKYNTYTDIDAAAVSPPLFEMSIYQQKEQFSQELQLHSGGDRLNWTAGVYYLETDDANRTKRFQGPGGPDGLNVSERDSWAVFAEGTYALTDQLDLTVGVRYSEEDLIAQPLTPINPPPARGTFTRDVAGVADILSTPAVASFDAVTPRVALQYQVNDDVMTYVSFAQGFSAGGINTREDPNLPNNGLIPFDEETLNNLEFGLRSNLLNGRLRLNASLFTSVWEDIIIREELVPQQFTRRNVGEAKASGLEIEGIWAVSDSFHVNYAVAWLDTEYTDLGPPRVPPLEVTLGSPFLFAPETSYSFGLQHNAALASGGRLTTRLDWGWQDDYVTANGASNQIVEDGYGLLSARVTYAPADGNWDIALFGTNLTDEFYQTGGFFIPVPLFMEQFTVGRPREIGLTMRFNF